MAFDAHIDTVYPGDLDAWSFDPFTPKVQDGKIVEVNLPSQLLPRVQVLEYIRAFLMGRMAWSKLNGLILISGAFGMFDKKIAVEAVSAGRLLGR